MEGSGPAPTVLYDDMCALCIAFAKAASALGRGRISFVGHYAPEGKRLGGQLGSDARKMFWLISGGTAYGGRAGLLHLALAIIRPGRAQAACPGVSPGRNPGCKTARAVFARSASIITMSRKVQIRRQP